MRYVPVGSVELPTWEVQVSGVDPLTNDDRSHLPPVGTVPVRDRERVPKEVDGTE